MSGPAALEPESSAPDDDPGRWITLAQLTAFGREWHDKGMEHGLTMARILAGPCDPPDDVDPSAEPPEPTHGVTEDEWRLAPSGRMGGSWLVVNASDEREDGTILLRNPLGYETWASTREVRSWPVCDEPLPVYPAPVPSEPPEPPAEPRRMQANPQGVLYHSREHDETRTCATPPSCVPPPCVPCAAPESPVPAPAPQTRCPQCGNAGWVLDAKIDKTPTTLELMPCIYPPCTFRGRDVAVLCLYGEWSDPVLHPSTGAVMSLSRADNGRWPVAALGEGER